MPKTWKAAEKGVARALHGVRVSNQRLGMATCDVEAGMFAVEVKSRKELPAWLLDAVAQAKTNARDGRVPIVVLHKTGTRYDTSSLVIMEICDFVDLHGELKPAAPEVVLAQNEVGE